MSFSRWKDDRFWPLFRDALLRTHSALTAEALEGAREYNFKRYHFQGIGRYEPDGAYARGLADLNVLAELLPASGFMFGAQPGSIDAALYGFIANIYFYEIDTPLRQLVVSKENLARHCRAIHAAL
jgi:Glutathione S-transferase, C-terminal domain